MAPPTERDKDRNDRHRDSLNQPSSNKPTPRFPGFGFNRIFPKRQTSNPVLRDSPTTPLSIQLPSALGASTPSPSSQVASPSQQSEPLSLDAVLHLLSAYPDPKLPPNILISHLQSATSLVSTTSPLPSADAITRVLLVVCASSSPADVRTAGFDLLATYLAPSHSNPPPELSSIEKSTFWVIIKSGQPLPNDRLSSPWQEWYPRFKALSALTEGGRHIDGMQGVIHCVAELAQGAATARIHHSLVKTSTVDDSTSNPFNSATHCILYTLSYLIKLIEFNSPALSPTDVASIIEVFDIVTIISLGASFGFVNLQKRPADGFVNSKELPTESRKVPRMAPGLVPLLPVGTQGDASSKNTSRSEKSPLVEPPSSLHVIPSCLYGTLFTQLLATSIIPSSYQERAIRTLVLVVARSLEVLPALGVLKAVGADGRSIVFSLRPSPRTSGSNTPVPSSASATSPPSLENAHMIGTNNVPRDLLDASDLFGSSQPPDPRNSQLESMVWELMRTLLGGTYAITVGRLLKKLAWANQGDLLTEEQSNAISSLSSSHGLYSSMSESNTQTHLTALQAEGSLRIIRLALRRAAEGRLARNWLSNQVSGSYGMSGAPTFSTSFKTTAGDPTSGTNLSVELDYPGLPLMSLGSDGLPVVPSLVISQQAVHSKSMEEEVMERAWGREGEGGAWEAERVTRVLPGAIRVWTDRLCDAWAEDTDAATVLKFARERVLREGLGIISDIIEECVLLGPDVPGSASGSGLAVGAFMGGPSNSLGSLGILEGNLVGEVIRDILKLIPARTSSGQPCIVHLSDLATQTAVPSAVVTTLLRVLSRIPLTAPITPPLASSLLAIPYHLSDETCVDIIHWHVQEGLLNPSAPNWLHSLTQLFRLVGAPKRNEDMGSAGPHPVPGPQPAASACSTLTDVSRHLAKKTLADTVTAAYQAVRDYRPYRLQLLNLCLSVWEGNYLRSEAMEEDTIDSILESAWNILADGIVAGAAEEQIQVKQDHASSGGTENGGRGTPALLIEEGSGLERRIRTLVSRVARESHCPLERQNRDAARVSVANIASRGIPPSATGAGSPLRSRNAAATAESPSAASGEREGPSLPPLMSFINALTSPSLPAATKESPATTANPMNIEPQPETVPSQAVVPHKCNCKSMSAVLTLITAFRTLAFSPPHSLSTAAPSRAARAPASHQCIHVFRDLLSLITPESLTSLNEDDPQWEEREAGISRAGKESPTGMGPARCATARLAILQWMVRLRADRDHRLYVIKDLDRQLEPFAMLVGRSGLHSTAPDEEGTAADEMERDLRKNRSITRRSLGGAIDLNAAAPSRTGRDAGRHRPQSRGRRESSRAGSRPPASPQRHQTRYPLWGVPESLPFDVPIGTRPSEGMTTFESSIPQVDDATSSLWLPVSTYVGLLIDIINDEKDWEVLSYALCHMPVQLSNKHLFCGPLTSKVIVKLVGTLCNLILQNRLASGVELPKGVKSTDVQAVAYHSLTVLISYRKLLNRPVLDALMEAFQQGLSRHHATVKPCLHALTISAFELQPQMTRSLSRLLGQLTQIVTNPSVSVYILELLIILGSIPALYANFTEEDYRRVFTVSLKYIEHHNLPDSASTVAVSQSSHALSQHVLTIAYYNIYVWFLAVKLLDRPKHVSHITRNLLIASSHKPKHEIDEPSEVCFDWLARYTYGDADPKPTKSYLGEFVGEQPSTGTKTWIHGNALVTMRTSRKAGWIEIESRRPSGLTRFLCRLENVASLGFSAEDVHHESGSGSSRAAIPEATVTSPAPTILTTLEAQSTEASHQTHQGATSPHNAEPAHVGATTSNTLAGIPSMRKPRDVVLDPSFMALQLSPYPDSRPLSARPRLVPDNDDLRRLFRNLDRVPVIDSHAIGILYVAPGQQNEIDILGNQHGSPAYTRFLHGLGQLLPLKNQRDVYTGALDTNNDQDGKYAFAWWDDIAQSLYHTATLMPNRPGDTRFAFKKMHIGNDSVRIVWNDGGSPYRFDTLETQFQFVNIVIEPHSVGSAGAYSNSLHEHEYFKVTCQRAPGMPEFGPIGEFKLVSAANLPQFVRLASLLADFFTLVYVFISKDTTRKEYITNWRHRLQTIRRFRELFPASPPDSENQASLVLEEAQDFTRVY